MNPAAERETPIATYPGEGGDWDVIGPKEPAVLGETPALFGREKYSRYLKGSGLFSTESKTRESSMRS